MSRTVWVRRKAGHYDAQVNGRRLEVIHGQRSWVVFVDNQNMGACPKFAQAKGRAVALAGVS